MCLVVRDVPASREDSLVVPSYKALLRRTIYCGIEQEPHYVTLFRSTVIPKNGMIIAERYSNIRKNIDFKKVKYGDRLHGGVIHACTNHQAANSLATNKVVLKSYSIGVCAYGSFGAKNKKSNNIASLCLYIPDLDFAVGEQKEKRLDACRNPTVKKIRKVFGVKV